MPAPEAVKRHRSEKPGIFPTVSEHPYHGHRRSQRDEGRRQRHQGGEDRTETSNSTMPAAMAPTPVPPMVILLAASAICPPTAICISFVAFFVATVTKCCASVVVTCWAVTSKLVTGARYADGPVGAHLLRGFVL